MIGTEQERAALMAHVKSYGDAREAAGLMTGDDGIQGANSIAERNIDAIRAMLAPPDDAVVIPRASAERAVEALSVYGHLTESMEVIQQAHDDADAIIAVLRGEATRDAARSV